MNNNMELDMNDDVHKVYASVVSYCPVAGFRLNKIVQTSNSRSIPGMHRFYTFL